MLTLELEVVADRNGLATATLRDGSKVLMSDFAAASATPSVAAKHGNGSCSPKRPWGHPPAGAYLLRGHARNTGAPRAEYGDDLFLFTVWFDSVDDETVSAMRNGRNHMLVYGGEPDAGGLMRRTQGGIRLSGKMIEAIGKRLTDMHADSVPLEIKLRTIKQRTWWTPWRKTITAKPLSNREPSAASPYDEGSLLANLQARFEQTPGIPAKRSKPSERDSGSTSSSSDRGTSDNSDSFRGQGGTSAGAGASGSWSDSGRVAAGVAAGAAGVMIAGAALSAAPEYTSYGAPVAGSPGDGRSSSGSWGSDSGSSSSSDYGGSSDSGSSDSGGGGD